MDIWRINIGIVQTMWYFLLYQFYLIGSAF